VFIAKTSRIHQARLHASSNAHGHFRCHASFVRSFKEPPMLRSIKPGMMSVVAITMLGVSIACKATNYEVVGRVKVPLAGLELQDPTEARLFLDRLNAAAVRACGGDPKSHQSYFTAPFHTRAVFQECRKAAVGRAVAEIGSPVLARVHEESHAAPAPRTIAGVH
jgi:UrcA family protein